MTSPAVSTFSLLPVGLCAFASMASMRICDAMLPSLSMQFSTTPGSTAAVISAFALAYGALQLFYGPIGDRLGKVRVVAWATLACTAGNAAAAFAPSLDWLIASRVVSGMAAAGIIPLTMAWIGDSVPYEQRQEVLAKLLGATVFGMIGGQWLGGLIADVVGWRFAFGLLALIFLSSGAFALQQSGRHSPAHPAPVSSWRQRFVTVLEIPWARTVLLVTCLEGALVFSALAFIPTFLHQHLDFTITAAGATAALYGVGGWIYSRCARRLLAGLGEAGLAVLGALCLAAAFGTIAGLSVWQWALPACLLAGFGFYALHNTLQTHATQMAPTVRGTAVSLFACLLFIGQSMGVVVAAWAAEHLSLQFVFASSGVGLLLLGCTFAMLTSRHGAAMKAL